MPTFNWTELLDPKKIAANGQWLVAGAVAGALIYRFVLMPLFEGVPIAQTQTITMRSPLLVDTPTYGCVGCSEGIASPTNESIRFY